MTTQNQAPINAEQALATVIGNIADEQLEMNQFLGRIEAMQALSSSIEAFSLTQLAEIKKQKLYRHFNNQTVVKDGVQVPLNTWAGFCRAINTNARTIDDKLENLNLLGEEALQKTEALGITTRQLRKLRQLDTEDQKVIIGEIETNISDKESIIELIEDMSVKHAKEKAELKKQVKDLQAESKAKDRVNADRQATIDEKNAQLNALEERLALKMNAPTHETAKDFINEMAVIETDFIQLFGKLNALYQQIEDNQELYSLICINMGYQLLQVKTKADDMIIKYQLDDLVSPLDDDFDWAEQAQAEIDRLHEEQG